MREYKPIQKVRSNLIGHTFGRLTVESLLGSYNNSHYWKCLCTCGNKSEVKGSALKVGNTTSCGCKGVDRLRAVSTTHGQSNTPLYGVWRRMVQRCEDANCTDYQYYGARGITVCDAWHDFSTFAADVGDRPEGLTIERIRNDEGYGPNNFRWASRLEQMQNTRGVSPITYEGRTMSTSAWAREVGIAPRTLNARLGVLGYSVKDAITKPVKPGAMLNGKTWKENGGHNAALN